MSKCQFTSNGEYCSACQNTSVALEEICLGLEDFLVQSLGYKLCMEFEVGLCPTTGMSSCTMENGLLDFESK